MNSSKWVVLNVLLASLAIASVSCSRTEEKPSQTVAEVRPYPLDTCLVCGMKLGDMGQPYTFVYEGQQIKVCAESEKSTFDKDPAKYLQKLATANTQSTP